MLEDRAKLLLKALIERYIADGQPIGSRTLARASGLELSPATIRNVMADLEDMGLIASPHTSAGRVPTPKGYRLFVDTMLTAGRGDVASSPEGMTGLSAGQPPQKVLADAASLLSSLSQFVGVVVVPKRSAAVRHMEFVRLSERRFLLITVSPDGDVQNRIIFTDVDYSASQLLEASNFLGSLLSSHPAGLDMPALKSRLQGEIETLRGEIAALMQAAIDLPAPEADAAQENVMIAGEHKLLSISDFVGDMQNLRRTFELFARKTQILRLLDLSHQAQGVRIYIGGERQGGESETALPELSVVSAPYALDGRIIGSLGVIGPTRMAYERMIEIVDITARMVSSALSHKP